MQIRFRREKQKQRMQTNRAGLELVQENIHESLRESIETWASWYKHDAEIKVHIKQKLSLKNNYYHVF